MSRLFQSSLVYLETTLFIFANYYLFTCLIITLNMKWTLSNNNFVDNAVVFIVLCLCFDLSTLLIFTVHNITCLHRLKSNYYYKIEEANQLRTNFVLGAMALVHLLQLTSWMNPGPCFHIFS